MKTFFLTFVSAFLLLSCSNDDNTTQEDFEPVNIEFIVIGESLFWTYTELIPQQNTVIYDELTWEELIEQMDSINNVSDGFSTTDIDFENFQLIVVIDKVKLTASGVNITSIIEYQDNIVVTPNFYSSAATAETQPFCIVQIPKSDKPVVFEVE